MAEVMQRLATPIRIEHDDTQILIWPQSGRVESLERFDAAPRRKRGQIHFDDPDSFARYVRSHATARTLILAHANDQGGEVKAILDHHQPEAAYEEAEKASSPNSPFGWRDAGWGEHVASYTITPTPEWLAWANNAGHAKARPQAEFALFLEDNADDIYEPTPPDGGHQWPNALTMLQVATTLTARTDASFASGVRLQNGQVQLAYTERIDATAGADGKLVIPERFAIRVSPFKGAAQYDLRARLRYRITGGRLTMWYDLDRPHRVIEHAFRDVCETISKATDRAVLRGKC